MMKEIKKLVDELVKFRSERNWEQFHTPENIAKSITIEACELLENFQWGEQEMDMVNVKEEVADVFGYLLLLCEDLGIDILEVTSAKIKLNAKKYPIDKAYGSSKKYNKL